MRCVVLQAGRDSDYCLTTFLSGLSFCINFHVSTFFYRHSNQRGDLCTPHKFQRCIILFFRMSQFSDSKGQRFESPRPHQRQHPFGRCLFLFCMRFYGVLRGGIRTARARRLTSRRAKKPLRGFFRARLGESPRPHQKCTFLHYVRTCIFYICLGLLSHRLCYSPITWPSFF